MIALLILVVALAVAGLVGALITTYRDGGPHRVPTKW